MSFVQIPGLADNDPVPGVYTAVQYAQGQASAGTTQYSAVLIANFGGAGSASAATIYGPDTIVQLQTEQDAINLFGDGYEAHRMWRAFTAVNKTTPLYVVTVAESSGAKATGSITITGTASAAGVVRVRVGGQVIDTGFASGDAATAIGTAVVNNVNGQTHLPVVASGTSAVTLTSKQKGPRGNDIRFSFQVVGTGTGVTLSSSAVSALSGGTTADDSTNALAAIANTRFYYQVSAAHDATQLAALSTQINSNAAPIPGIRCRGVAGSIDTLAATITLATGLNQALFEMVWQQNSDMTPAELAANNAAVYSLMEQSLGALHSLNFDGFGNDAVTGPLWRVQSPSDGTIVSRASIKSALLNGITPIGVSRGSSTYLVKRITTRSLNGSVPDYRIRDAHKVTVCDRFADDASSEAALDFGGMTIGNDPGKGQVPPAPTILTPRVFKSMLMRLIDQYDATGLLQNADQIKADMQVVREVSPSTRISAIVPLQPIDIADQIGLVVNQVA